MGWRIIEISSKDYLKLYLDNLIIKRDSRKLFINLNDIDVLLLDNYKINLSVQLINSLTFHNAIVITFNSHHEPASYIYSVNGHHGSLKVLEKQLQWNQIYKGKLWKTIIQNKINNQLKHLISLDKNKNYNFFISCLNQVKNFDVTNREGHAAKVYWHELFGLAFIRDYNSNQNPIINAILNYGYAILRAMVIKSIVKKGLDCRISLFHKSISNFFALASDLMEPFRIIVDQIAFKHQNAQLFSYAIKEELMVALTKKVYIENKSYFLNNAIDMCVDYIIANKGWLWVDIWK